MAKVTDEQLIDAIKKNAGIVSGIITTLKKEYGIELEEKRWMLWKKIKDT